MAKTPLTVVGAEKYGIALDVVGATALFRYVLWNILGVAVYCLAKRVPHFSRQMLYALLAPALLLPLAFIPALHTLVYSSGDRFEGFVDGQQPNILATDSAIACAIAWTLLCHAVIRRLPKGRQLGYLTLFLCLLTVLWLTQSRSQLIAAFLALLVGSVLVLIGYADATQRRRIIFRTVLFSSFAASTIVLLNLSALDVIGFMMPRFVPSPEAIIAPDISNVSEAVDLNFASDASARVLTTAYYLPLVLDNLWFGIGVSFITMF